MKLVKDERAGGGRHRSRSCCAVESAGRRCAEPKCGPVAVVCTVMLPWQHILSGTTGTPRDWQVNSSKRP